MKSGNVDTVYVSKNGIRKSSALREVTRSADSQVAYSEKCDKPATTQSLASVGVHWFRGTIKREHLKDAIDLVELYFGPGESQEYGRYCYDRRYWWPGEISVYYCSDQLHEEKILDGRICLDISGGALDTLTGGNLQCLLIVLRGMGFRSSRIDIFLDDFSRVITPHEINDYCNKRFKRYGFKPYSSFQVCSPVQKFKNCQLVHDEMDFGVRGGNGSGCFLRIYDKALESDGKNNAIRYECEFAGEKADVVFQFIGKLGTVQDFIDALGALVGGSIDFYKNRKDKNLDRCSRADWWDHLIDIIGRKDIIKLQRGDESIPKKKFWIESKMAATLTMLKAVAPTAADFADWLESLASDSSILKQHHKNIIAQYKLSPGEKVSFAIKDYKNYFKKRNIDSNIGGSDG